jgi:hypothetical protein
VTETKVRVGHVPMVLRTRPALDTDDPEDDAWTEESALTLTDDGYEVSDAPRLDPDYARDFANRTRGRIGSARTSHYAPSRRLRRAGVK